MLVQAIKTRPLSPPQDDLYSILDAIELQLSDGDIICITSKIISIHEGRTQKIHENTKEEKDALATQEAEMSLPRDLSPHSHVKHTITQGNFASSAGIDTSNGKDYYILWPEDPSHSAKQIALYLKKKYGISQLAVIITDSRSTPLRYGAIGYAIGAYGIAPLHNYVGEADIFGRSFKAEQANIVDSLASTATYAMGEGAECTPLCIIKDAPHVTFDDTAIFDSIKVPLDDDMYYPFLKIFQDYL